MLGIGGGERLEVDIKVVTSLAKLALDVLDGGLVTGRAKDTVALLGGVGKLLKLARTVEEVLALDVVAEVFLWISNDEKGRMDVSDSSRKLDQGRAWKWMLTDSTGRSLPGRAKAS